MQRPSATFEILRLSPLVQARWEHAAVSNAFHSFPQVQNHLSSLVGDHQQSARDAGRAGVLLVLKVAVWNDDRIVRDRTYAR
jgi:hypothetical protein